MIVLAPNQQCTGCTACYAICANDAISMIVDKNGCRHPVIDENKCIGCHKCEKSCPILNPWSPLDVGKVKCFAAKAKDDSIRLNSSSGGIFYLLAKAVIDNSGYVFGCIWQMPEFRAVHVKAERLEDILAMRGSKYVQSDLGNAFSECRNELKAGHQVLFSGTPCQIAGLNHFLGKNYENLVTIEVICHGVPMAEVFEEYKRQLRNEHQNELSSFSFRSKCFSWRRSCFVAHFQRATKQILLGDIRENPYGRAFINNLSLRESCFDCQCKAGKSHADITLGDFWGIESIFPDLDDDKGISAVILHTPNGMKLWKNIANIVISKECSIEDIVQGSNKVYSESVLKPDGWKNFISKYRKKQMDFLVKGCLEGPWYRHIIRSIRFRIFLIFHRNVRI